MRHYEFELPQNDRFIVKVDGGEVKCSWTNFSKYVEKISQGKDNTGEAKRTLEKLNRFLLQVQKHEPQFERVKKDLERNDTILYYYLLTLNR